MFIFSVPLSQPDRNSWISAIEQHQTFDYYIQKFSVCSLHFKPDALMIRGKRTLIVKGAVPSIFDNYIAEDNLLQNVDLSSNETIMENNNVEPEWNFSASSFGFSDDEQQRSHLGVEEQSEAHINTG